MRKELEKISVSPEWIANKTISGLISRIKSLPPNTPGIHPRDRAVMRMGASRPSLVDAVRKKMTRGIKRNIQEFGYPTFRRAHLMASGIGMVPKTKVASVGRGALLGGLAGAGHGIYTSRGKSGKDKAKDIATRTAGGAVMGGAAGAAIKALGRGGLIAYRRAIGEGEAAAGKAISQAREALGQGVGEGLTRGKRMVRQEASRATNKLQVALRVELREAHRRLQKAIQHEGPQLLHKAKSMAPEIGKEMRKGFKIFGR
jgi:hypothetical protein